MENENLMLVGNTHDIDDDSPFITRGSNERRVTLKTTKRQENLKCLLFLIVALFIAMMLFGVGLFVGFILFGIDHGDNQQSASCYKDSICAKPPVLLISLDGFKPEYLTRGITPHIMSLIRDGVKAEHMSPSFPSKTFPNHFTLVSGLYPEQHGIVDNYFYDSRLKETFSISAPTALDPKWWLGEPIWVTAHNASLKTAVYYWPGSEVPIEGILPDIYFKYNKSTPFESRVSTVLGWFDLPDHTRPQFMASYFEEPDGAGHKGGPDSDGVNEALKRVDDVIGDYIAGLKERDIYDCVNIVLVSDHGMTTIQNSKIIQLVPDLLSESYYNNLTFFSYGLFSQIFVNNLDPKEIYNILKENIKATNASVDVYLRENAPLTYNIGQTNLERYGDIFLIAQVGGYIKTDATHPSFINIGQHGYNNSDPEMNTIFIGRGPSLKQGVILKPFQNIELYNLLCELLHITPSANNGTEGALNDALRNPN